MKFRAEIQLHGKSATGIEVPAAIIEELGAGKKPPVSVTIGGGTYRSTVASRGGRYLIPLSAENRRLTGTAAGDTVEVEVELDSKPRELVVPSDLSAGLDSDPDAKAFFDSLSFSQKRWYVEPIESAKKPETRERRVEKAMSMLREERKR
jgi:Bacteriocin-protection, YdeI or OmpD-Associated/Domain of unknown function (DUF1905)